MTVAAITHPSQTAAAAKLAGRYRERKVDALARIEGAMEAVAAGDPDAIEAAKGVAHGLSGVCGAFGEADLGLVASEAEDVARDRAASPRDIQAAMARLARALAESLAKTA